MSLAKLMSLAKVLCIATFLAAVGSPANAQPVAVQVAEFYHAGLDHYFLTANNDEAYLLDNGITKGWKRTGFAFGAYARSPDDPTLMPVCRFYGRPEAGLDSHFYSASPPECADVVARFSQSWALESLNVFQIEGPDPAGGTCAQGTVPVHRLFNNRNDANHRYTTDATVVQEMVALGYTPEGIVFCATGARTPAPSTPPTIGAPGSWTRYATSYQARTEAAEQSWYNLTWDTKRNLAYGISWQKTLSAFDPVAGRWSDVIVGSANDFHNRTTTYDPLNDRVWVTHGTGTGTGGFQYFDPATKTWAVHSPNGPSYEAAMIFDPLGKRFIAFGGWADPSVRTFALAPIGTGWQGTGLSGGPTYTTDAQKMTAWRSALDSKRNRMVYVDTDGSLWALPLTLTGWTRIATSGTPPPAMTQFVYDVANDALVGWSASPRIAAGDTTPGTTRETWLLPLSSLAWSRGASLASGQTVPPNTPYVSYSLVYDPVRQQTLLHTNNGDGTFSPETWAYRYPSGTTSNPTVSVTATATAADTFTFTSTATPSSGATITAYQWQFGDGTGGTGPTQAHKYVSSGTYTVSLNVTDSAGKSASASTSVTATVGTPPPPPPPTGTTYGTITAFALPALAGAPYSTLTSSKHTNMAYSPLTNRLYVSGGDWVSSATDGTWSMSLVDGSWRKDVGDPVYPSLPAPHAAQDGMGFVWMPARNQFVFWPGSYFAYEPAGSPILNYAKGTWFFNPATNTWTQQLGLFGSAGARSGSVHGGVYDEVNDHLVVLLDNSSGGPAVRRWSLSTMAQLPNLPITIATPPGKPAHSGNAFTNTLYTKIGREVFVVGFSHDGNGPSSQVPRAWKWHLDAHTFTEIAAPPVTGSQMREIETRLGNSHGKVVWPFHSGPDGELHGIYVYNPATNQWAVDTQVPGYGNFIGNAVTSLPDGRVAFSGGVFGRQQTHMWFYEAN